MSCSSCNWRGKLMHHRLEGNHPLRILGLIIGIQSVLIAVFVASAACAAGPQESPAAEIAGFLTPHPGKFSFKFHFRPSKNFLFNHHGGFGHHGILPPQPAPPPPGPPAMGVSVWFADFVAPNNILNRPVLDLPASSNPPSNFTSLAGTHLHADFGTCYQGSIIGIPWNIVDASVPLHGMSFFYSGEADYGPPSPPYPAGSIGYPIPSTYLAEGSPCPGGPVGSGDDHDLFVVPATGCLFETGGLDGGFSGGAGADWNLYSNTMRPDTWTSADAAGLPIAPLLVKYAEVQAAVANGGSTVGHAFRFTLASTLNQHIWPARHDAGNNNAALAPMGMRIALRANYDVSGFSPMNQVILNTMKVYGMFVSDNGSNGYITGDYNPNWDDSDLHNLSQVTLGDFYVVDESSAMLDPNSYQATVYGTGPASLGASSGSGSSGAASTAGLSSHTNSLPRAK